MKSKLKITPSEVESALAMQMPRDRLCRCVELDYQHTVGWHEAVKGSQTEEKDCS